MTNYYFSLSIGIMGCNYYNLDLIISVGYRVKPHQGTNFESGRLLCKNLMHGGMRHERHHLPEKWLKMTSEERKDFIRKKREHIARGDFHGLANHVFGTDDDAPKD